MMLFFRSALEIARSHLERLDVKPHKHILKSPLLSGITYLRQNIKKKIVLGNYYRGKLQICAVQKLPALYVCFVV